VISKEDGDDMTTALILGAGPAGCAAAYFLRKEGIDDITIYERKKLGGCAHTRFYDGIPYEFGPQIMFTDKDYLRCIFEEFLPYYPPPNPDGQYKYVASVDGTLDDVHDFPITVGNVLKMKNPADVIYELYQINLENPNYENFEKYCISRVGRTLYETYIKNYNRKAWQMDPADMDTEWVKFRPLTLQRTATRFGDQWQGHPGNFNPMWEQMTAGVRVECGEVTVGDDLDYYVDQEPIKADLIVTTLPMSNELEFVNACLVYIVLKSQKTVMPRAFTTFPNTYDFVRVFEYRQQFYVESEYTLISFGFRWRHEYAVDEYIEQTFDFCKNVLKKEVVAHWVESREGVYPLNTRENMKRFQRLLERTRNRDVIPVGRAGMHAYCSKDTAIRMGLEVARYLDELLDPDTKIERLLEMRKDLH